jgi:ParB family chromosome partitioning protein
MPSAPKSRLGRGLNGLMAAAKPPAAPAPVPAAPPSAPPVASGLFGYQEIAVSAVEPSKTQARKEIPSEQLAELASSINSEGLLQPIVVRRVGDKFELIAGERRWRAFQLLKLKSIPARITDSNDKSAATLGLIENLQRENLNPIDEANGYASLVRDFGLTQDAAADRVGKSRPGVANLLRLLTLDAEIQGYLSKQLLSTGHAKVLLGISDTGQRQILARRAIGEGLSVRATEKLVQTAKAGGAVGAATGRRAAAPQDTAAVESIQRKLGSYFGARVAVLHTPKKGRIVIPYSGNEDLQRILDKLKIQV